MAIDGTQKRNLSSKEQGFNYGFNASPEVDLLSRLSPSVDKKG